MASSEQNLDKIVKILDSILNKSKNSAAYSSANNKAGIYNDDNSQSSTDASSNLDKLSKAAENASRSIGMDDAVDKISSGFSSILKATGKSLKNAISLKPTDRLLSSSISQVRGDLYKSSSLIKDAITDTIENLTSIHGLNTGAFLKDSTKIAQGMKDFNDIMDNVAKNGKISESQAKDLRDTYGTFDDKTKDLIKTFGGADATINDFIKGVVENKNINNKVNKESIESFKTFSKSLNENREVFSGAVVHMSNTIKQNLNEPLRNLRKEAEQLGPKLQKSLMVGLGVAATQTGNVVNTIMRDGFRDASLGGLASTAYNAADFGQGQTEFLTNIREFRNVIRVFGDNADVMKVAASQSFNTISESIREDFNIIGKENTQLMTSMMDTLIGLGIDPTESTMLKTKDNFKDLGIRGTKDVVQVAGVFNALSKNKAFKAYQKTLGRGADTIDIMTKNFKKLQSSVGMTIDGFSSLQQSMADRMKTGVVTRITQAAMLERLSSELGSYDRVRDDLSETLNRKDIVALLKKGDSNSAQLEGTDIGDYLLLKEERQRLFTEAVNSADKSNDINKRQMFEIIGVEQGGLELYGGADTQAKLDSGYIAMMGQTQTQFEKTYNIQSTFFTRSIALLQELAAGLGKGPIGAIGGGILVTLGGMALKVSGALTVMSLYVNGLKKTIMHPILSKRAILTGQSLDTLAAPKQASKINSLSDKIDKIKNSTNKNPVTRFEKLKTTINTKRASRLSKKLDTMTNKATPETMKAYLDSLGKPQSKQVSTFAKTLKVLKTVSKVVAPLGTALSVGQSIRQSFDTANDGLEIATNLGQNIPKNLAGDITGGITKLITLAIPYVDSTKASNYISEKTKALFDNTLGAAGTFIGESIFEMFHTKQQWEIDAEKAQANKKQAQLQKEQERIKQSVMFNEYQQSIKRSPEERVKMEGYLAKVESNGFRLSEKQIEFQNKNQPKVEEGIQKVVDFLDMISGNTDITNKTLEKNHQEQLMKEYLATQQNEMASNVNSALSNWNA